MTRALPESPGSPPDPSLVVVTAAVVVVVTATVVVVDVDVSAVVGAGVVVDVSSTEESLSLPHAAASRVRASTGAMARLIVPPIPTVWDAAAGADG
jgi:hypothetical protein